ncbi:hypothetical protein C1T31_13205 [Hanstruepera neustonica]|uniref:DUF4440 domain-containing protein n=1 Tax=Hanstruepera neustonica TaxID=1445657 RepID=A0A2K1DW64_9FLAO|nr:hypothetical protein [Hanstruepera neustonica]PNQ72274.1 hypothetical protein C1T31_13205 [Hanstruepera neustonica]
MSNYLNVFGKPLFGIMVVLIFQSCENQHNTTSEIDKVSKDSISEIEIKKTIEDLYEVYSKSDLQWVDFYKDKYNIVSGNGTVKTINRDSLRVYWKNMYEKYNVILNNRGKPILSVSGNQAFHYNTFDEILINKTTNDTIENIGTWVVLWKKQKDGSWKIEFETYNAK